jgi:hypothetical protein
MDMSKSFALTEPQNRDKTYVPPAGHPALMERDKQTSGLAVSGTS